MQLELQMLVAKDISLDGWVTRLWRLLYTGMLGMCIILLMSKSDIAEYLLSP